MSLSVIIGSLIVCVIAAPPEITREFTVKRTPSGIYLSWSASLTGLVGVWRGTEPGRLSLLTRLPAGQTGFMDLGTKSGLGYSYALGDRREHGAEVRLPAVKPIRVLAGLVTTCSGLTKGSSFPANTQNYFVASRDPHVQYYGYFLLRPFDPAPRTARLVWRDSAGLIFSEYTGKITPKEVDLPEGKAGQLLLAQAVGLRHSLPQNGQKRVPVEPGIYTVEAFIDNVPVALTVFFIKKQAGPADPRR